MSFNQRGARAGLDHHQQVAMELGRMAAPQRFRDHADRRFDPETCFDPQDRRVIEQTGIEPDQRYDQLKRQETFADERPWTNNRLAEWFQSEGHDALLAWQYEPDPGVW